MSKYTFEDFLMEMHAKDYIGTDDNMVDDFAKWVQDLEVDDFFNYGDKFAKKQSQDLLEACKEAKRLYDHFSLSSLAAVSKYGDDYEPPTNEEYLEMRKALEQAIKKAESN